MYFYIQVNLAMVPLYLHSTPVHMTSRNLHIHGHMTDRKGIFWQNDHKIFGSGDVFSVKFLFGTFGDNDNKTRKGTKKGQISDIRKLSSCSWTVSLSIFFLSLGTEDHNLYAISNIVSVMDKSHSEIDRVPSIPTRRKSLL